MSLVTTSWKNVTLFEKDLLSKDSAFHKFVWGSASFVLVRLQVYRWCLRCCRSRAETVGWGVGSTAAEGKWSHVPGYDIWWQLWVHSVELWCSGYLWKSRKKLWLQEAGKSSSRHGSPKELFWVRKLGKETEKGIEIRFKQRWQRGTGLANKGRKGRKSTKNPRLEVRREWRTWNVNTEVVRNRIWICRG